MSDRTNKSAELLLLCGKVRDDALTPGDAARLDELLQGSDQAKALYVQYMSVVSLLESRGVAEQVSFEIDASAEQDDQDVLLELLALERAAEAPIVEQPKAVHLRVAKEKTPWEFGGALRYVIGQPATWTAAAAVLALALILGIVFSGGDEPGNEIAQQPDFIDPIEPGPVGPVLNTAVATLTNTHNAQWAHDSAEGASAPGSLQPGSKLHPNTRLTLTAGFAEITTNDGAIAILQAPATIELLDNDNAIRLHTGKLIGICETESSKGFVVKTKHADITDLGTEFGVHAHDTGVTTTVFTGEVEIVTPAGLPERLTADQTATLTVNGNNRELDIDDRLAVGFDALRNQQVLRTALLRGSGEGLAVDTHDPNWLITAIDGETLETPLPLRVTGSFVANQLNTMTPTQTLRHNPTDGRINAVYRIETTLRLPDGFDAERDQLAMRFRVDNELLSLKINGQAVQVIKQNTHDFGRDYAMGVDGPLKPGDNPLIFEVKNDGINNPENPVGLQVAWELEPLTTNQAE